MSLVVAGTGGDSGKTLVSLGLASAWRRGGVDVQPFKKGPDYIDAAWLTRAAGRTARHLDTWIMGREAARRSFETHDRSAQVSLIEGNRGLFDGLDGTSTAELAKLVRAPVVIVLDITKTTRTAAAFVAGCRALDPDVVIAGVVLNRVGGPRHVGEARAAVEELCDVPVVGAVPKLGDAKLLPDRHLGLVPPEEHDRMDEVIDRLADVIGEHVDVDGLLETAGRSVARAAPRAPDEAEPRSTDSAARVGVFRDAAFTFYYPENLEALQAAGAELVEISPLADETLPEVDLLYVGGGFPETHAPLLSGNRSMLRRVREAADAGLPVYAECGGLIYLSRAVRYAGRRYPLTGVLDVDVEVLQRPQGHGYAEALTDRANPFFEEGAVLRGHEFHYSRIVPGAAMPDLALRVRRGAGSLSGRDGLVKDNVFASWIHLHALGTTGWADALVARARDHASTRAACGSRTA